MDKNIGEITNEDDMIELNKIITEVEEGLDEMTDRAMADYTIKLAGWLSRMSLIISQKTQAYYIYWEALRMACETNIEATNRSKASDYYREKKYWTIKFEAVNEMIQTLKKKLYIEAEDKRGHRGTRQS